MLDHPHTLSSPQATTTLGVTLFGNSLVLWFLCFVFFFVLENMFINCLEWTNSKGFQTADKATSTYISYIKYKRLPLLSFMQISTCSYAFTYSGTEIHSQQIS